MKSGFWNKKIPTIAALILLFSSVWITSFLIQKGVIVFTGAAPDTIPQNVTVSNITDTSFTASFTSTGKSTAALNVEDGNGPVSLVFDDRNKKTGEQTAFYSHFITVTNLKPETQYSFSILSDGETYLDSNEKYTATTGKTIDIPPTQQDPIFGKVLLPDGSPSNDTIVKFFSKDAQTITALTNNNGEYIIPTNSIRNSKLDEYMIFDQNSEISIDVFKEDMTSNIKLIFANSKSIPTITLLKNYDFASTTDSDQYASTSSQLSTQSTPKSGNNIEITTPKENSSIIDDKPLFQGTAAPNQAVKITINSSHEIKAQVKASSNGSWSYRPSTSLSVGEHTITIETVDVFGILRKITQSFTVYAAGSQVDQTATPSATTPTPSTTTAPTSSPTPTITASPTATLTPSPILSEAITATTTPTIPAVGNVSNALLMTVISLALIISGSALLFLL